MTGYRVAASQGAVIRWMGVLLAGALLATGCAAGKRRGPALPPVPPAPAMHKMPRASVARTARTATAAAPQPGDFVAVAQFGGAFADSGQAVAVDRIGNVFVGGTIDGGGGVTHPFLAKRAADGTVVWSSNFGGGQNGTVQGVAVDTDGNVLMTGSFFGTLTFAGGGAITSSDRSDIFIVKLTTDGILAWSRQFGPGSPTGGTQLTHNGLSVAVDKRDNAAVLTGIFDTPLDFGGGTLTPYYRDVFLLKLAADGSHIWSRHMGGARVESTGNSVSVATNGNICLAGSVNGFGGGAPPTVDFGGGSFPAKADAFAAKYTEAGAYVWARIFTGTRASSAAGIAVMTDGLAAVLVGKYTGTINFGDGDLTNPPETPFFSPSSAFVLKLRTLDGIFLASQKLGDSAAGQAFGVAVAADESVTVGGSMSLGATGIGTAHLGPDGDVEWTHPNLTRAVAVGANWITTGAFSGTTDFGGGPVTAAGQGDIYLAEWYAGYTVTNAGPKTNLDIVPLGPFEIINPDGSTNRDEVLVVWSARQPADHELKIEASLNPQFNFSVAADWACYPSEQRIGLYLIVPKTDPARFYRSVNTPCVYSPPAVAKAKDKAKPVRLRYLDKQGRIHTVLMDGRNKLGKLK